jgi:cardiolipin synthase
MNISAAHVIEGNTSHRVRDLHFQMEGPIVAHLQETFAEDWMFSTGERLQGDIWFPSLAAIGRSAARGIISGPDEDFEKIRWSLLGAFKCAQRSILLMTPYFVPDQTLINAINLSAMSGVAVDIVLPEENNLAWVKWASSALLWQVLEGGCRLWSSPPPFDHTKVMVVDETWILLGSANLDMRSLRLNFEFDVEVYDPVLAKTLAAWVRGKIGSARRITVKEVNGRSVPVKLRDGIARLFSPYL